MKGGLILRQTMQSAPKISFLGSASALKLFPLQVVQRCPDACCLVAAVLLSGCGGRMKSLESMLIKKKGDRAGLE